MTPLEQAKADAAEMLRQDEEIRAFEERLARDIDAFMAQVAAAFIEELYPEIVHGDKTPTPQM
jgi:molecular chaperone GrpE (heat shock protein)